MLRRKHKWSSVVALVSILLMLAFTPVSVRAQEVADTGEAAEETVIDDAAVPLSGENGLQVSASTYIAILLIGVVVLSVGTYMFVKKKED